MLIFLSVLLSIGALPLPEETVPPNWSLPSPVVKAKPPVILRRTHVSYPGRALREMREGTTRYVAHINEYGRAISCTITDSSGSDDLDRATCDTILGATSFDPAHDFNGNNVPGIYSDKITWKIPNTGVPVQIRPTLMTFYPLVFTRCSVAWISSFAAAVRRTSPKVRTGQRLCGG